MPQHNPIHGTALAVALALSVPAGTVSAAAETLPKPTQAMLAKLKLPPTVLAGIDDELKVPQAWIDGAKKEGKALYLGTFNIDNWPKFIAIFKARYPFAAIEHQRTSHFARVDKPLIALKEGSVITDLIAPVGARIKAYKDAGALMDLRVLPNFRRVPEENRAKDGTWVGEKLKYWCMSYNTSLVKAQDLPQTWDDLLTDKALHNGNLAISDRPHNWILPLWTTKGPAWTRNFVARLFGDVKPQLRREGALALVKLNIAGEFHAAIPATDYRVADFAAKGAPLGWHCPSPVPTTLSELVALKGTHVPNTVKIFINWYLSKEGQLAIYYTTGAVPVRDFPDVDFAAFPKEIRGKKLAVRTPENLIADYKDMAQVWGVAWKGAGGYVEAAPAKVKAVLSKIVKGGREIAFKVGNETRTVKLSKSRSKVTIGGKPANRSRLKAGLNCEITYAGDEARLVACR